MFKHIKKTHQPNFNKIKYQILELNPKTKKLHLIDHRNSLTYYQQFHEIKSINSNPDNQQSSEN